MNPPPNQTNPDLVRIETRNQRDNDSYFVVVGPLRSKGFRVFNEAASMKEAVLEHISRHAPGVADDHSAAKGHLTTQER